jgi:hypothetical protein
MNAWASQGMLNIASGQSFAIAAVACGAMCALAWLLRHDAAERHARRVSQLRKSAELFQYHTRNLELFLEEPSAPRALKAMLVRFTDVMSDRQAMVEFARWMSRQPLAPISPLDTETQDLLQLFDELQRTNPELARTLSSSLLCGVFGAMLRWPESARYFDLSGPNIAASGRWEVAAAVRASKMRSKQDFGLSLSSPVAA